MGRPRKPLRSFGPPWVRIPLLPLSGVSRFTDVYECSRSSQPVGSTVPSTSRKPVSSSLTRPVAVQSAHRAGPAPVMPYAFRAHCRARGLEARDRPRCSDRGRTEDLCRRRRAQGGRSLINETDLGNVTALAAATASIASSEENEQAQSPEHFTPISWRRASGGCIVTGYGCDRSRVGGRRLQRVPRWTRSTPRS